MILSGSIKLCRYMSEVKKGKFCEFCDILKLEKELLYHDDEFFAFHDISKATAVEHVLVCTNEHLESAYDIKDAARLRRMKLVGESVLRKLKPNGQYRFGFHTGRYISVHHVHLHCFVLPFGSIIQDRVRYGHMLKSVEHIISKLTHGKL